MHVLALITARGGSKGLPGKNILPLAGKPLIAWTIEAALNSRVSNLVIVSTDDEEIAQVSRQYGAEVPFLRPAELAQDDSDHISVVVHAIRWLEQNRKQVPDYVMLLQPTSPLRTAEDIDAAVQIAEEHEATAVVSVCEMKQHPYLARSISEEGTLQEFVPAGLEYLRRQAFPSAYSINGAIYLNRSDSILRDRTFFPSDTYPYIMPAERSLDIDSAWDLHLTELILRGKRRADGP